MAIPARDNPLGVLLGAGAEPTVIVAQDEPAGHDAVAEFFEAGDLRLGRVEVDVEEGDAPGRLPRGEGRAPIRTDTYPLPFENALVQLARRGTPQTAPLTPMSDAS